MAVRQNFIFDEETAAHLEELTKKRGTSQTQVVKDLIEEAYQEISVAEKLKILEELSGSMDGLLKDKSIQSIKASMDV